jgi:predicted TIM-barrel fold metal-dependent hydrolase
MAQDDIEQAVVYPTQFLGISSRPDLDFAEAQARAYNHWVADYCNHSPSRLFGIAAAPQTDLDRCIRVVEDARKLGHVGVFLRPNPNVEGVHFCDASYDRLWAAFQDLDIAVGFHPFLMPDMPGRRAPAQAERIPRTGAKSIMEMTADEDLIADGTYGNKNIFFTQALGNVFDMQIALTMLICGGVLERFPRLRCIFLEANGGWIVPILERLDHHYEIFRWEVPQLKMKPSEYFKRQCWISFDPDESTLKLTAESPLVGADRIIWASDYPHPDAKIPGVVGELREQMVGLPDAMQQRIFGLNCGRAVRAAGAELAVQTPAASSRSTWSRDIPRTPSRHSRARAALLVGRRTASRRGTTSRRSPRRCRCGSGAPRERALLARAAHGAREPVHRVVRDPHGVVVVLERHHA